MPRFHIPPPQWDPAALALSGAEAHHCSEVMRCSPGDRVTVFDGAGRSAEAEVTSAARGRVELRALSTSEAEPRRARLHLCQAIPKGKNMELVVQKATELGAARITPLITANTVVKLGREAAAKKQAKWQRIALEACKQCGQDWLPEVDAPRPVEELVGDPAEDDGELRLVASLQPGARHLKEILHAAPPPTAARILIGPEGDFTPAEVERAIAAGHLPMTLGPIVLRTETAAIYCLSVLAHELF